MGYSEYYLTLMNKKHTKMSSNQAYTRICNFCHKEFSAQTRSTKYCSHKCNQRAYKLNKRKEVKSQTEQADLIEGSIVKTSLLLEEMVEVLQDLKTNMLASSKPFLTPKEVCLLLSFSRNTFDRLVGKGTIPVHRLGGRRVYVRRIDLEALFLSSKEQDHEY